MYPVRKCLKLANRKLLYDNIIISGCTCTYYTVQIYDNYLVQYTHKTRSSVLFPISSLSSIVQYGLYQTVSVQVLSLSNNPREASRSVGRHPQGAGGVARGTVIPWERAWQWKMGCQNPQTPGERRPRV